MVQKKGPATPNRDIGWIFEAEMVIKKRDITFLKWEYLDITLGVAGALEKKMGRKLID